MAEITYGSANTFNSASSSPLFVAVLDATHFVAVYQDAGNSNQGTAIVGVISGTTISSYGTESTFNAAGVDNTNIAVLDSTHFVVAFRDGGDSDKGKAILGSVSGTTITHGSESQFTASNSIVNSVAALDSTHFVIVFRDIGNSSHGTAIVGVTSGTTISSYGSTNVFNAASTTVMSVAALDSTHFVVVFKDGGDSDNGKGVIGVISGTTISSYGSESTFNAVNTNEIAVTALDATHFVVAYQDTGGDSYGAARVGTTDGSTTIDSFDTENIFNSAVTTKNSVAIFSEYLFVVAYNNAATTGDAIVGSIPEVAATDTGFFLMF